MNGPFDYKTRWDEVKYLTENLIYSITKRPVDICFLNREACLGINIFLQIEHVFYQPKGFTPIKNYH